MNLKALVFSLLCMVTLGVSTQAQSFFKAVPRVATPYAINPFVHATIALPDSTLNTFRPIASIAAYVEPGNIAMAGAGVSYQHLKWDYTNQKWNCVWSISALGFAGGSIAPTTPASIMSYGVMVGVFNNLLMVGPVLNGDGKVGLGVSVGISLNNGGLSFN